MVKAPSSRNAICPCGSGRRYKHCHGGADNEPANVGVNDPLAAAHNLLEQGKFKEAVVACEEIIAKAGADLATLRVLGNSAALLGDVDRGGTTWQSVLTLVPDDPEALFHLANLANHRGDTDTAIAFLERALLETPSHTALLNNLGSILQASGRLEEAEQQFRRAHESDNNLFESIANLAQNLFQQKRFNEALSYFKQTTTRFKVVDASIWANYAVCQHKMNDLDGALESFRRAFDFEKDSVQLYLDYGVLNRQLQQYKRSSAAFEKCLSLDPGNVAASIELLYCRMSTGNWQEFEENRALLIDTVTSSTELDKIKIQPFSFLALCDDPQLQFRVSRAWVKGKAQGILQGPLSS